MPAAQRSLLQLAMHPCRRPAGTAKEQSIFMNRRQWGECFPLAIGRRIVRCLKDQPGRADGDHVSI